ncbi:sterol desaturase family protein [Colwellia sp. 1_MG-2023]|uniref:sterol desaturase family protein n=1 Tax=Colwellia sp. 1_MG-2023 TaxID=3062649 RepID=UPI0026E3A126|nr:sterol desaturase family protein [Colwellia sp. 1_MG-2023]MDO6446246.1 sterol desaturase family protein [Colwellia sp. 1_MG-2023]
MPTPIEILLDPVSLTILVILGGLLLLEFIAPGRKQPKPKDWYPRAIVMFILYFYLSTYMPMIWDSYLSQFQIVNLESLNPFVSAFIALLIFEFLVYVWHRAMHQNKWLWRIFHQMHHSAERVDVLGAFYFSPLDMIGFTMLGSLSLVVVIGVTPEAASYFLYASILLATFQHTNIKTPQWLGYIVQRPESHSLHHGLGIHRYNYSDLPIFDMLFGTFKNPKTFVENTGFYDGASSRIVEMIMFKDVSSPK